MRIDRKFTRRGVSPYEGLAFVKRSSEIRNPDGSTVFKLENIDVPEAWSQLAVDILAQKYFRKAGVPQCDQGGQPLAERPARAELEPGGDVRERAAPGHQRLGLEHVAGAAVDATQAFAEHVRAAGPAPRA